MQWTKICMMLSYSCTKRLCCKNVLASNFRSLRYFYFILGRIAAVAVAIDQCSRKRILRIFKFQKNMTFYVLL